MVETQLWHIDARISYGCIFSNIGTNVWQNIIHDATTKKWAVKGFRKIHPEIDSLEWKDIDFPSLGPA